jgi:hypothetical protein
MNVVYPPLLNWVLDLQLILFSSFITLHIVVEFPLAFIPTCYSQIDPKVAVPGPHL